MLNKTHLPVGACIALSGITFIKCSNIDITIDYSMFFMVTCFGSIFPDIDKDKSWISQLCPIPFHKILTHRKETHSKYIFLLSLLISFVFSKNILILSVSLGFGLGMLSHVYLDIIYTETRDKDYYCRFERPIFYLSWFLIFVFICILIYNNLAINK